MTFSPKVRHSFPAGASKSNVQSLLSRPEYLWARRIVPFLLCCGAFFCCLTSARAVTITSSTHPNALFFDFSAPEVPFTAFAMPGGVPSGARFAVEDGALVITNEYAGSFGVDTKLKPFDAEKLGHLFFDYRLAPDVKVNFFFKIKGKYHGAVFSGPQRPRPGAVLLGKIDDVRADGKWHRAHIPLRDWLRKLYPTDDQLPVAEVIIGNWDNTGWLMAGVGGNGPGAQWSIDNFALAGAGPVDAKFQVNDSTGAPLTDTKDYRWALGNAEGAVLPGSALVVSSVAGGFHILQLRDKAGKPAAAYPFIAASGPSIGSATIHANRLRISINAPAGLDTKTLTLLVGGKTFDTKKPSLLWDGAARVLSLDAAEAGFVWKDGETITAVINGLKDTLGRALPAETVKATMDYSKQQDYAPALPLVDIGAADMGVGTFEEGLDPWTTKGAAGAIVERDSSTHVSGSYAVCLTSPANASPFEASIRTAPFDAVKYPIITFNYRASTPNLRADFMLSFGGKTYYIQFTDKDNPNQRLGIVPNVIADNKWHRGEIDLAALLRAVQPNAAAYQVDWLSIGDAGWLGNENGTQLWFDNFQFVPALPGSPLKASVRLKDATGLKAIAWVLDERPDTMPPFTANGTTEIETTGTGRRWLHVRAQNGAGKWSAPVHISVLLQ